MDRKMLKVPFTLSRTPDWVCPTCVKGVLRIKKGTFFQEELQCSRDHSHEAWIPEWIEYVYSCLLVCSNCKEVVSSSGIGFVDYTTYEDENGENYGLGDLFQPKFFEPHLTFFSIPKGCPESVSAPLKDSFRLLFAVPSAASNSVRVAIEKLLTELKIKRFELVKGKRRFISLHQRIDMLQPKYAELIPFIRAIKWLGNAGSHGTISMDDVMDSYEFTEHILHAIYAPKSMKLAALAKKVNKKKGPVK